MYAVIHASSTGSDMNESTEEKEVIDAFWRFFEEERTKRGLSYLDVSKAYRGMGRRLNQSSIFRASDEKSKPSTKMLETIAYAFDMPLSEVMERMHLTQRIPKEFLDGNPTRAQVLKNAMSMTIDELDAVIALQNVLIEQRKRRQRQSSH